MARQYNSPGADSKVASDVGEQFRTDYYNKEALVEAAKEQYFSQLADTTSMPRNFGKTIKRYHYLPLLDDRNDNDEGIDAAGNVSADGNLYGSSKDIGTINSKLPVLSETGGRVNRVGFKRIAVEGTIEKMGFFDEYTQESLDFDTDSELRSHITREMVTGANQITEAMLQSDLIEGAGTVRFGGTATDDDEVTGEGTDISVIDYEDLMRMSIDLDNNRTPKHTRIISGTRIIDTRVIDSARFLFIGSEMLPTLRRMKDLHDNPAFIAVQHYAASGSTVRGEVGTVDQFRIIVVPEMQHDAGAGATATEANAGYRTTGANYDVYPMLVVGDGSFTTIGFQTDGSTVKFRIFTKAPGEATADRNDPYGEMGFMSIKWYYGTMILRPERIAIAKSVAEL